MAVKKPLSFNLDDNSPSVPATSAPETKATKPELPLALEKQRKQIGARIPAPLYRQLKAHAALSGVTVGEMVEAAIGDYLQRQA